MMYTIASDPTEYTNIYLALAAAQLLAMACRRSITIFKNGEPFRLLRY